MKHVLARAFVPNRAVDGFTALVLVGFWVFTILVVWLLSPWATLPKPGEVFSTFSTLWTEYGMGAELLTTFGLILKALAFTIVISMLLSYATVIAFFRPLVAAVSKLRFLGLTGLVVPFTLWTSSGASLKVALLTFGMTTFFVTAMAAEVMSIPRENFDHMRVLGAGETRILWEVVIRGTLDKALEVLRQNLAIGWAMITMVEGISRAEGGLGALILNQYKHFKLAEVYAILLLILGMGLLMDYGMGVLQRVLCPHLALERVKR
jgi:NitT/TauT family transport system permease protein